jgi:hypothetical protein
VTLVELIVAMTVGGVALALIAIISLRQQRLYADIADRAALTGQLRQASAVLPIELRGASPSSGDIRDARDTVIELRSTIATAVVCDTIAGSFALAPAIAGATAFAGFLTPIAAGDTAWIFARGDSADTWIPYPVSSVSSVTPGACGPLGPKMSTAARATARVGLRLSAPGPIANGTGSVTRVTRPVRYSLYRGGDGRWYLGQRDWNVAAMRFNTVQPVSGPFLSASSRGLVFQYLDSAGTVLPVPVTDPRSISLIQVDLRGQSRNVMRAFATGPQGKSTDSARIAIAVRNRR